MACAYFLKLDGIEGQSSDREHDNWLELLSLSHGALQNINIQASDVQGRGQFMPFTFTHVVDKATPHLQVYCMSGKTIKIALFAHCRILGGEQTAVYEIRLEQVRVAKAEVKTINPKPDDAASQQLIEEVELIPGKLTFKVTPIKPDGTKDGAIEASWDQIANA
jgi:type VI secretion system secreted protein Hcp